MDPSKKPNAPCALKHKGLDELPTSPGLTKRVMGLWRLPWVLKTMAADVGEIMKSIVQKKGSACCRALVIGGLGSIERWLESLVNKEPRNHKIDFVPPFIPPH